MTRMHSPSRTLPLAAALTAVAAACTPAPRMSPEMMSMHTRTAAVLSTADQAEIAEGQLAQQRAQSPAVRQYGQMMVSDHSAAMQNRQSMSAAMASNMDSMNMSGSAGMNMAGGSMPAMSDDPTVQALNQGHATAMQRLGSLSGTAFDRAYMQRQVEVHQYLVNYMDYVLAQTTPMAGMTMAMGNDGMGGEAGSALVPTAGTNEQTSSTPQGGRYAVPLSCDPGRTDARPGNGRDESSNTSAGNVTNNGSCNGDPANRPPLHNMRMNGRMTPAQMVEMQRMTRALLASHLEMARRTMSGI